MMKKFVKSFIGLALLTTTLTYADQTAKIETKIDIQTKICYTEDCMSTQTLQEHVEKLSLEGKLPFEMGLELMKRWSDDQIS